MVSHGRVKTVTIHTDGGCAGNPGPGGWAAVLRHETLTKELSGGEPATTNNRMELTAAIAALGALKEPCRVELHTDSEYPARGHHVVGGRLEGARLAHRRPEAGQERRPVAAAR